MSGRASKVGTIYVEGLTRTYDDSGVAIAPHPGEVATVNIWSDGEIKCEDDRALWCEHIEQLMLRGSDGDMLPWVRVDSEEDRGIDFTLNVPMFPTLNIYVPILFVPIRLGKSQTINVLEAQYAGSAPRGWSVERVLGYLNPGEGLAAIRDMLIQSYDVWQASYSPHAKALHCTSSSHSFAEQMKFECNIETERFKFRETYCVWYTGKCSSCQAGEMNFDMDQFVPEKQERTRNPFK